MGIKKVERSISSENTFTDRALLTGYFNLSVSGTWSGTVTVQRSFDGNTWHDVRETEINVQEYGFECERGVMYQAGIKTGNYISGTVTVRLSQ